MLSSKIKTLIAHWAANRPRNKRGGNEFPSKFSVPFVVVLPDGSFTVALRGRLTKGCLMVPQPWDYFETEAGAYCLPASKPVGFAGGTGWKAETFGEFFGCGLPQFLDSKADLSLIQREIAKERADQEKDALILSTRIPKRELEKLPILDGHILCQQPPSARAHRVSSPKKKFDAAITLEQRIAYLEKGAKVGYVPPVRVYAAIIQQPESVAGAERDRLLEGIVRRNQLALSWKRYTRSGREFMGIPIKPCGAPKGMSKWALPESST